MIANFHTAWQLMFLVVFPFLMKIMIAVKNEPSEKLDPWLKRMALTTLLFVILFGVGLML